MFKHLLNTLTILNILFFMNLVIAKPIPLFEQPKAGSKNVGTIDPSTGIIPIFTPKDNPNWVKVADPHNGNVGWVKSTDLGNNNFSFTITTPKDGKQQYQMIQFGNFGNTQPYSQEQMDKTIKEMQLRNQAIQRDLQRMMNDMYYDMHQQWMQFPMLIPVMVIPEKNLPANKTPSQSSQTQPAKTNK